MRASQAGPTNPNHVAKKDNIAGLSKKPVVLQTKAQEGQPVPTVEQTLVQIRRELRRLPAPILHPEDDSSYYFDAVL